MFNSLASFILGNRNATDIENHNQRGATDEAIDNNFKFVSTNCKEFDDEEDNEWLLVEKGGIKYNENHIEKQPMGQPQ